MRNVVFKDVKYFRVLLDLDVTHTVMKSLVSEQGQRIFRRSTDANGGAQHSHAGDTCLSLPHRTVSRPEEEVGATNEDQRKEL